METKDGSAIELKRRNTLQLVKNSSLPPQLERLILSWLELEDLAQLGLRSHDMYKLVCEYLADARALSIGDRFLFSDSSGFALRCRSLHSLRMADWRCGSAT